MRYFVLDDDDEDEEWLDDLMIEMASLVKYRYALEFKLNSVPKSSDFVNNVLFQLDENRFKAIVRVTKSTFFGILRLISLDPVFHGENAHKQKPIWFQLLVVFVKCGSYGKNRQKTASFLGCGDGSSMLKIMMRVFTSILNLTHNYIKWPNEEERIRLVEVTKHEFPGCIGYVDGSEIKVYQKPGSDHEAYFSRKSQYCVKVQAVCDYQLKITHLVLGYSGSVHDGRIYGECALATNPSQFFSEGQFLLGDKAYKLTSTVITPFKENSGMIAETIRNKFNRRLSKFRIRIEHLFGVLTERFESLKELRIDVKDVDTTKYVCQWILVCCVLHNIILDLGLEPVDIPTSNTKNNNRRADEDHSANQDSIVESFRNNLAMFINENF